MKAQVYMVCVTVWHVTSKWHLDIVCTDTASYACMLACMHVMHASGDDSTEYVPGIDVSLTFSRDVLLSMLSLLCAWMSLAPSQYTNKHGLWWASGNQSSMFVLAPLSSAWLCVFDQMCRRCATKAIFHRQNACQNCKSARPARCA